MGVRILEDIESGEAVMYCSTSGWAFGPVFGSREEVEKFLEVYPTDPRKLADAELALAYSGFVQQYVCECGMVRDENDAELKATKQVPAGCTCHNNGGGDCPWCEAKAAEGDWEPTLEQERFVCFHCQMNPSPTFRGVLKDCGGAAVKS